MLIMSKGLMVPHKWVVSERGYGGLGVFERGMDSGWKVVRTWCGMWR